MKFGLKPFLIIPIWLVSINCGITQDTTQPTLLAGIAKINITPQVPIRMSGYGNRDEPFSGIHDSIYATAIVLEMGDEKVALVAANVVGFSHEFVDQTQQLIQDKTGIPSENILLIAAHNHGGPVTSVYSDDPTATEMAYFESLQNDLAQVVGQASKQVLPAKVGAGTGKCRMNINRRARHAEGGIWLGRNPEGPCDSEVGLIKIDNLQNKPIAAFLNWPCHATVSGQENTQITGDWPGAAAHSFTNQTGTLVMVTAGASADINPIYGPNNKFNDISAIGQLLGDEAVSVFNQIETHPVQQLQMAQTVIQAAGKKRSASRMPGVSLDAGDDQRIRITVLKIGNIVLAGISGELMTEIGLYLKEQSPFKNTFIVTHCNGSSGYLCTDQAYQEGGYEPMVAKTMPGTEAQIKEAVIQLLNNF